MASTKAHAHRPLLEALMNLAQVHREHEKFYAASPRELAVVLQRHARTLQALADRWTTASPSAAQPFSPYQGAEDLNDPVAVQLDGVLFMEGAGTPMEVTNLIGDLRASADSFLATGEWLAAAMQGSWDVAAGLVAIEELADVLGERHRIIINDWQAASMSVLVGRVLQRAAEILDRVDFAPRPLRDDLAGARVAPRLLYSAAELVARAADLCSDSAGLVHDNERRWRTFRNCVGAVLAASAQQRDDGQAVEPTSSTVDNAPHV